MTTFIPSTSRSPATAAVRKAIRALPLLIVAVALSGVSAAAEAQRRVDPSKQASSRAVVDPAVKPAGGVCRQCGPGECGPGGCRHGHHRDCRDGACVPYCPVRPGTFGFYGTQWRRWPGSGVVPVSNEQAATPVRPQKSAVPKADEESFGPEPSELPEPDFPADDASSRTAPFPAAPEPDAAEPTRRRTPPATPEADAAPAVPEAAPEKSRPAADNLFDDSAARKVRRKIPVTAAPTPAKRPAANRVQPATHQEPATAAPRPTPKAVPRVAFDPRQESARLREPVR